MSKSSNVPCPDQHKLWFNFSRLSQNYFVTFKRILVLFLIKAFLQKSSKTPHANESKGGFSKAGTMCGCASAVLSVSQTNLILYLPTVAWLERSDSMGSICLRLVCTVLPTCTRAAARPAPPSPSCWATGYAFGMSRRVSVWCPKGFAFSWGQEEDPF